MTKKINGYAKWIAVTIVLATLVFNSGILYNNVNHLSKSIEELKESHLVLNEKFDKLLLSLVERSEK